MKFKYPKKIKIGSVVFKVIYDKNGEGAHLDDTGDTEHDFPHIYFGMKYPQYYLENVLHELKEGIQLEQGVEGRLSGNSELLFNYGHKEHTDLCARLAGLLSKFIK